MFTIQTHFSKCLQYLSRFYQSFAVYTLKHHTLTKKPYPMRKEKIRWWCMENKWQQLFIMLRFTFEEEWTNLRDKELQVVSEGTCKVRIHSTVLKVSNSTSLMGINAHQCFNDTELLIINLISSVLSYVSRKSFINLQEQSIF